MNNNTNSTISLQQQYTTCEAFNLDSDYDEYVDSIAPKRELVCPITQEVFRDPVVAEDGYTYERTALLRWFSMGRTRSPVTNSLMTERHNSVYPNIAIQGMANLHREKLGLELLHRCRYIYENNGKCPDNGSRIAALLDAGADTTLRINTPSHLIFDGNTCLLFVIQCQNLQLSNILLDHECQQHHNYNNSNGDGDGDDNDDDDDDDSNENNNTNASSTTTVGTGVVTITNANGISCIQSIEDILQNNSLTPNKKAEWEDYLTKLKFREEQEREIIQNRNRNRQRANEEHREQQRSLLAASEQRINIPTAGNNTNFVQGLGSMQTYGWGYFPSLAALQFQGSIPPPSVSTAFEEIRMKEKLKRVLNVTAFCVLVIFLFT